MIFTPLTKYERKRIKKDLKYTRMYLKYIENDKAETVIVLTDYKDYFFVIALFIIFTIIWFLMQKFL